MIVTECREFVNQAALFEHQCDVHWHLRVGRASNPITFCYVRYYYVLTPLYYIIMLSCLFTSPKQNPDCGSQLTRQWRFCASASPWSDSSSTCVCQLVTLAPTLIGATLCIVDQTFYTAYDVNVCSYSNLRRTRLHAWASSLPWTIASWTALKLTGES